jgi:hypothetical protein
MAHLRSFTLLSILADTFSAGKRCAGGSLARSCCKVCDEGKPWGDTCIDADDTCHVGDGCAC